MFQGCSGAVPGCSGGVPGVFRGCSGGVPGCSGVFRGVPGVFRVLQTPLKICVFHIVMNRAKYLCISRQIP